MSPSAKATRIRLFSLRSLQMRTFHLTWVAFHLCFFGWFGIAPLMAVVREDLGLSRTEIGNTIIASVAATIIVRLIIGPLCDRYGPRRVYTSLLALGALPVMLVGLADSYETFLLARLAIGAVGAAFVITQYHTAVMFAPNVVGTAQATTAGWGNLGGGTTQIVMPLLFAALVALGVEHSLGWRLAMVFPGLILLFMAAMYWRFTRDCPEGDYRDLRAAGRMPAANDRRHSDGFWTAAKDIRVWALFLVYAACFGVELTIHNIAALYFFDRFEVSLATAGIIAGSFGLMNLFARTLGGWLSDRFAIRHGLDGRVRFLFIALFCEGLALLLFSQAGVLAMAIVSLLVFSLFVQMAEGATFGVVPFVNRRALGAVAGIVGAGGNVGAVAAGFLFRSETMAWEQGLFWLGIAVLMASFSVWLVRFSPACHRQQQTEMAAALAAHDQEDADTHLPEPVAPSVARVA